MCAFKIHTASQRQNDGVIRIYTSKLKTFYTGQVRAITLVVLVVIVNKIATAAEPIQMKLCPYIL